MKAKARDAVVFWEVIQELQKQNHNVLFSYFVVKNKLALQDIVEPFLEVKKTPEDFLEYERKRVMLAQEHADKDEYGQPSVRNNNFVITQRAGEFQQALQTLRDEYESVLTKREEQLKAVDDILDKEIEFNEEKIELSSIPELPPLLLEPLVKLGLIIDD